VLGSWDSRFLCTEFLYLEKKNFVFFFEWEALGLGKTEFLLELIILREEFLIEGFKGFKGLRSAALFGILKLNSLKNTSDTLINLRFYVIRARFDHRDNTVIEFLQEIKQFWALVLVMHLEILLKYCEHFNAFFLHLVVPLSSWPRKSWVKFWNESMNMWLESIKSFDDIFPGDISIEAFLPVEI
jgi:hypothetical protein